MASLRERIRWIRVFNPSSPGQFDDVRFTIDTSAVGVWMYPSERGDDLAILNVGLSDDWRENNFTFVPGIKLDFSKIGFVDLELGPYSKTELSITAPCPSTFEEVIAWWRLTYHVCGSTHASL